MVNLGFVRDFNSCPTDLPRIFLPELIQDQSSYPTIKSWPHHDNRVWELHYYVSPNKPAEAWTADLAKCLTNLHLHQWCLNIFDLINIFQLPLDQAMSKWGSLFWPEYNVDAIVYLPVKDEKDIIKKEVQKWEKSFTHLVLRPKYDLTLRSVDEQQNEQNKKALSFKFKALNFFKREN